MAILCYRIDVLTHTWHAYFLTKAQYHKKYGPGALACCEEDEREIYLRIDCLTSEAIAHELMHAYIHEHSVTVMDPTGEQMEELCCDIVAKYGRRIHEQADQVVHAWKVLRGRRVR